MGQAAEVSEVTIKFEGLDGFGEVGKTASGTVGEIAKVEVTPIAGGTNPGKPLVVENEAESGLKWTALGKTSNSFYRSAGKDYKFDGTSGESHKFAFKGGGAISLTNSLTGKAGCPLLGLKHSYARIALVGISRLRLYGTLLNSTTQLATLSIQATKVCMFIVPRKASPRIISRGASCRCRS